MQTVNDNLRIVTVRDLMKEHLTIPGYQRPYRWNTETALTLLTDTHNAFVQKVPEYRMGTVVLHRSKDENKKAHLNVVDGQQRLTTLSIMFFVFCERLPQDRDKTLTGLETMTGLLEEKYNALSCEAIVNNLEVLRRKIKEIDKSSLAEYVEYILDKCTLVKIITENEQEAFQFFDSQNSRGKELAPHDLLKSYHLREMKDEPEETKKAIVNKWENTPQQELKDLFSEHLYPLVRWYKGKDALRYGTKDIKTFKGIKTSSKYNFSVYSKAANLYIEHYNMEKMYELASGKPVNQFQLTQPIVAGKRFFQYSLHYMQLYKELDERVQYEFRQEELVQTGAGDAYVYNLFINVLMFYADKFSMEALTKARMRFLYRWAFSLRLCMKAVYRASVNRYALGSSDRVNTGLNLFSVISEMQQPEELDAVILENVSEEKFRNSKINLSRYKSIYDRMFGKGGNENE